VGSGGETEKKRDRKMKQKGDKNEKREENKGRRNRDRLIWKWT